MTIIDELLILLDDLEETETKDIPRYFDEPDLQVLFSALGRLVNKGWVTKKNKKQGIYYTITLHGVNELNKTLDAISHVNEISWDKQWHYVVFDIPEAKRKLRDQFRLLLKDLGYGILKSSVWVSPWDKQESLRRFAKRHNIEEYIFYIQSIPSGDHYGQAQIARICWDWKKIEDLHQQFLKEARLVIPLISTQDEKSRFRAKKLVFRYAKAVKEDPGLPMDIAPNSKIARKAYEFYVKIRPYCLRAES